MNPAIFRPNDLRGIVDQDFNVSDFKTIGQAYAKYLLDRGAKKTVIGRDNRLHSKKLQDSFTEGLLGSGIDVVDIGLVTTPQMYFSRVHLDIPGGVCITASHNPPEWNGAKLCFGNGAIHEEEIGEVANNVLLHRFDSGKGKLTSKNTDQAYINNIMRTCDFPYIKSRLKAKRIGIDCGNGMAGPIVTKLFKELGVQLHSLYPDPDGTYPHHLPNPAVGENMRDLWQLCSDKKLDLGFAYDGDVDRINVIDDKQVIVWGDGLTIFFAREVLQRLETTEILYDIMCSPAVPEDIGSHKGISIMVPSGHALIAHRLHRLHAPMAGEYSGHLYFNDGYLGFDDAIYATFRMLNILSRVQESLSKLMSSVPAYKYSGMINVPVSDSKKDMVIEKLTKQLEDKYFVEKTGGIRTKIGPTWASIHPSGTEEVVRIAVWGKKVHDIEKTRKFLIEAVNTLL